MIMGWNPLISVVIPVYNTKKYLRRCMESVVNQTYRNLEIICIDDGSTDGSGAMLDAYAARDERVRVVHQENRGLVASRKAGVALASGDYVSYVDSDDAIALARYEELLDKGIRQRADIIFAEVTQVYGDGRRLHMKNHYAEGMYGRREIEHDILTHLCDPAHFFTYGLRTYLWGVLFARPLICACQPLVDDAIAYGEDVACMILCLDKAQSVYMAHAGMYFYYKNTDSMCHARDASPEARAKAKRSMRAWQAHMRQLDVSIPADLQPCFQKALRSLIFYDVLMYDYADAAGCVEKADAAWKVFPFGVPWTKRIILYGAGGLGMSLYRYLSQHGGHLALWCDRAWKSYRADGFDVHAPEEILRASYDCVLMAIGQYEVAEKAAISLVEMGVPREKIVFMDSRELTWERLDKIYGI